MQPAGEEGRLLRRIASFARISQAAGAAEAAQDQQGGPACVGCPTSPAAQPLLHAALLHTAGTHPVGIDPEEALPVSSFMFAAEEDDGFLAGSTEPAGGSILRSRSTAADSNGVTFAELSSPLSRAPSGIPVLRRSGTSLRPDGAAFAAIDMPPLLSRHPSFAAGSDAAAAAAAEDGDGGGGPPSASGSDTACFGRMRPSVGIALSVLCFIAAACIFSAWLPQSVHDRAHIALRAVLPKNGSLFEPRQDVVIIFKQDSTLLADLHMLCGQTHAGAQRPVAHHPVSPACNLAKACSHVFGTVIRGIAGSFSRKELQLLESCLPGAMHYMETDAPIRHMMKMQSDAAADAVGAARELLQAASTAAPVAGSAAAASPAPTAAGVVTVGVQQQLVPATPPAPAGNVSAAGSGAAAAPGSFGQRYQTLVDFQWNLDRVCKRNLPLDHTYTYGTNSAAGTGAGTTIYIVDSGLQPGLEDFANGTGAAASRASAGWNAMDSTAQSADCFGHGSALASIAAGKVFGVAKAANVVGVRVLDCNGQGSVSNSIAGLDWVAGHVQKPAVVVLSLGLPDDAVSHALDQTVNAMISQHGIPVVVAAGNGRIDACGVAPASVPAALTVAATNLTTKFGTTSASDAESLYRFSNFGTCVDISCPGVDIPFACSNLGLTCITEGNISYSVASGTSFSAPHVAGVAAIFLSQFPTATPDQVKAAVLDAGTPHKLQHSAFPLRGTPDLVLYSMGVLGGALIADSNASAPAAPLVADSDAVDSAAIAPAASP